LLQAVRAAQDDAAKNGRDPWLYVLREAWLRIVLLDFAGARRLCDAAQSRPTRHPTHQLQTLGLVAQGYDELEQGRHESALASFAQAREPGRTGKFFLHWLWRMTAHQGSCDVLLRCRKVPAARAESARLLEAALSTADPHLHVMALDTAARVALAEGERPAAERVIRRALGVLEQADVPTVAWRVHATAWDLHRGARDRASTSTAQHQRDLAVAAVLRLAGSLDHSEPLRAKFLAAGPVRRIFEGARVAESEAAR
jgi:hypothetical protein